MLTTLFLIHDLTTPLTGSEQYGIQDICPSTLRKLQTDLNSRSPDTCASLCFAFCDCILTQTLVDPRTLFPFAMATKLEAWQPPYTGETQLLVDEEEEDGK